MQFPPNDEINYFSTDQLSSWRALFPFHPSAVVVRRAVLLAHTSGCLRCYCGCVSHESLKGLFSSLRSDVTMSWTSPPGLLVNQADPCVAPQSLIP